MPLYQLNKKNLVQMKRNNFKLEKEIQEIIENNLEQIMQLELVKSEFTIKNKRIYTLAFDPISKSFIIIEYKRNKNSSVMDQGLTYLSFMLQNRADFILEYNEKNIKGKKLNRNDVDWSQTRVVFISTGFTENQIESTNFKDVSIELWEVQRYEKDIISIEPIQKNPSAESIKPIINNKFEYSNIVEEIKVYTEKDHLNGIPDDIVELYENFKQNILNLTDHIEIKPLKLYIAFKYNNYNICDIVILKKSIKIFINKKQGTLEDPKNIMRDISKTGHWGNGDYEISVEDNKNIEYIMSLIKQVL